MLKAACQEAQACTRCPRLAESRTQVVWGTGDQTAELMFIADAPSAEEDRQGLPLIGSAGQLFNQLLGEIGLRREDVFVTHAMKCHPPDNRAPTPAELSACDSHLTRQIELVAPVVVCPLGNVATKLLRADPTPLTQLHGRAEVLTIGGRAVRVLPLFHPVAALYQDANVQRLRADVRRLPELLAMGAPPQPVAAAVVAAEPAPVPAPPVVAVEHVPAPPPAPAEEPPAEAGPGQLELF